MALRKEVFLCKICKNIYFTEDEANNCEKRNIVHLKNHYDKGDKIEFIVNSNSTSGVISMKERGTVLGKIILLTDNALHIEALVVKLLTHPIEQIVFEGLDGNLRSSDSTSREEGFYKDKLYE